MIMRRSKLSINLFFLSMGLLAENNFDSIEIKNQIKELHSICHFEEGLLGEMEVQDTEHEDFYHRQKILFQELKSKLQQCHENLSKEHLCPYEESLLVGENYNDSQAQEGCSSILSFETAKKSCEWFIKISSVILSIKALYDLVS